MIRYGPAGIPLSCKGRTLKDGIEDVHNLALTALEVQLVRPRTISRPVDEDEEAGKTLNSLPPESEFVLGIDRDGEYIYDRDEPIMEEDNLIQLLVPPTATFNDLPKLGKIARRHDVALSSHTPYYMDLTGNIEGDDREAALTNQYYEVLIQAGIITDALDGEVVVTSLGPYDERLRTRDQSDDNIFQNISNIMEVWQMYGLKPKVGIEVTGQSDVFGSAEQIFDLCDQIDGLVPVLNFAHYQARSGCALETPADFADLIGEFANYNGGHIMSSFSNVEVDREKCYEKVLTPLKKGDLKFERLAETLAEINPDMTIISSSPLLEHDAVYMRTLTERVLSKKAMKVLKERRKEQAKAEKEAEEAAAAAAAESEEPPAEE